jgi:flagellar biosynthesis/type III secretory pathway protein FliH
MNDIKTDAIEKGIWGAYIYDPRFTEEHFVHASEQLAALIARVAELERIVAHAEKIPTEREYEKRIAELERENADHIANAGKMVEQARRDGYYDGFEQALETSDGYCKIPEYDKSEVVMRRIHKEHDEARRAQEKIK